MLTAFTRTALRVTPALRVATPSTRIVLNLRFLSSMRTGTVKWFDSQKGYGFIIPDDGSRDIFVHQTSIHAEGFRSLGVSELFSAKNLVLTRVLSNALFVPRRTVNK